MIKIYIKIPKKNADVFFTKQLLSRISAWEYEWLTKDIENEPEKNIIKQRKLFRIENTFESYNRYFATMYPLLELETMGTVIQALKDKRKSYLDKKTTPKPPICFLEQYKEYDQIDPKAAYLVFRSNFMSISSILFIFINCKYFSSFSCMFAQIIWNKPKWFDFLKRSCGRSTV